MSLEEIEQALQQRIDHMAKMDDYPIEDWLRTYEVLAQVKQAQASESLNHWVQLISHRLDDMDLNS